MAEIICDHTEAAEKAMPNRDKVYRASDVERRQRTAQSAPDPKITVEVALREAERCRAYPDRVLNEEVIVVLADELLRLRSHP